MRVWGYQQFQWTAYDSIRTQGYILTSEETLFCLWPVADISATPSSGNMSDLNRRGFVKTLLVTAAGASRIKPWRALVPGLVPDSENSGTVLEHGDQQLRVSAPGAPFTFQNFLRT